MNLYYEMKSLYRTGWMEKEAEGSRKQEEDAELRSMVSV